MFKEDTLRVPDTLTRGNPEQWLAAGAFRRQTPRWREATSASLTCDGPLKPAQVVKLALTEGWDERARPSAPMSLFSLNRTEALTLSSRSHMNLKGNELALLRTDLYSKAIFGVI
jgi:hypothetical protein